MGRKYQRMALPGKCASGVMLLLLALDARSAAQLNVRPATETESDPVSLDVAYSYTTGYYDQTVSSTLHSKTLTLDWTMLDIDFQAGTSHLDRVAPAGTIVQHVHKRRILVPRMVESTGNGDLFWNATKEIIADPATALAVNLVGGANYGTADSSKGLGTGKNDYFIGLTASYPFDYTMLSGGTKFSALGSPGKIVVNGIKEDIRLKDVWSGYIALSADLFSGNTTSLSFNLEQPTSAHVSYYQVWELSSSYRINRYGGVRVFADKGLTQNSPDWSAGLSLFAVF